MDQQLHLATKRLSSELSDLKISKPSLVLEVGPSGSNLFEWSAIIEGPADTVYSGGKFRLKLLFGKTYPLAPPTVLFETKIFHCNISAGGRICLDILKKEKWTPTLTVSSLLLSIVSLLGDANPDDPLQVTVAALYLNNKAKHDEVARKWTARFAK